MAKIERRIALGIGAQTNQATAEPDVLSAVNLSTAIAGTVADTATGILLRDEDDYSGAMQRIETDGGTAPGSFSRLSGTLRSIEPAVSFVIDAQGSNNLITPLDNEYDYDEYFLRILAGSRMTDFQSSTSDTTYEFVNTQEYQTLKIWIDDESWTLVGCTFDLAWAGTAGDKSRITVTVFADEVVYVKADTFPPQDITDAYGNQKLAAPILQSAASALDGVTRGFDSFSLAITYASEKVGDCNAQTGIINAQTGRTVSFTGNYYADTLDTLGDFEKLERELQGGSGPLLQVRFTIGQIAGAGQNTNSQSLIIPALRVTDLTEVAIGSKVGRAITGYATIGADSAAGSVDGSELRIQSV